MIKVAVCAIAHPQHPDLFLHFQRSDTGKYTCAGGHFNEGETPEQAAVREMKEETGIDPDLVESVQVLRNQVTQGYDGSDIDLYLVDIKLKETPVVDGTVDVDSEPVPGTFVFLNPLETKKPLNNPPETNILIQQLQEKVGHLGKSETLQKSRLKPRSDHPFRIGDRVIGTNGETGTVSNTSSRKISTDIGPVFAHEFKVKIDEPYQTDIHKRHHEYNGGKWDMWHRGDSGFSKLDDTNKAELEKTRGRLEFKKLPKVTTRPDQEIMTTDTPRQGEILGRKVVGEYLKTNYQNPTPEQKKSVRDNIVPDIKYRSTIGLDTNRTSNLKESYKNAGIDVKDSQIISHGGVVGIPKSNKQFGFVQNEGLSLPSTRREHESIHFLMKDIEAKYGYPTRVQAEHGINRLIHPKVQEHLNKFLGMINYDPLDFSKERLPHLYEMLHDSGTRDIMRQVNPDFKTNETEIMNHAKRNWRAIREFAANLEDES